jgi:hypothetical protein
MVFVGSALAKLCVKVSGTIAIFEKDRLVILNIPPRPHSSPALGKKATVRLSMRDAVFLAVFNEELSVSIQSFLLHLPASQNEADKRAVGRNWFLAAVDKPSRATPSYHTQD